MYFVRCTSCVRRAVLAPVYNLCILCVFVMCVWGGEPYAYTYCVNVYIWVIYKHVGDIYT